MSLKEQWNELIGNANANVALVNEYYNKETEAYKSILSDTSNILSGTLHELAQRFDMSDVIFTGFIDGANDSLKQGYDLDSLTEDTAINLDFDYEKLFYNMLGSHHCLNGKQSFPKSRAGRSQSSTGFQEWPSVKKQLEEMIRVLVVPVRNIRTATGKEPECLVL